MTDKPSCAPDAPCGCDSGCVSFGGKRLLHIANSMVYWGYSKKGRGFSMEMNNEYEYEYENEVEQAPAPKKKRTGLIIGIIAAVIVVLAAAVIVLKVLIPGSKYAEGEALLAAGQYEEAIAVFEDLGDFKDSPYMVNKSQYKYGVALYEDGEFKKAMKVFKALGDFKDSEDQVEACEEGLRNQAYTEALALYNEGKIWTVPQKLRKKIRDQKLNIHPVVYVSGDQRTISIVFQRAGAETLWDGYLYKVDENGIREVARQFDVRDNAPSNRIGSMKITPEFKAFQRKFFLKDAAVYKEMLSYDQEGNMKIYHSMDSFRETLRSRGILPEEGGGQK